MAIVSAKNETVRIFENDFLEWCSHIHPATPLVGFTPVVAWLLWHASHVISTSAVLGYVGLGLWVWICFEYWLHRWIFHYEAKTKFGQRIMFFVHGVHHAYPQDATRLVMPLAVSFPLGGIFYLIFIGVFAEGAAQAVAAGLYIGYVVYDCVHYGTHHLKMKNPIAAFWKRNHLKHHFSKDGKAYTILIPFWDYVFGTTVK